MGLFPAGTALLVDEDNNGSYTEIADVTGMTPPKMKTGVVPSTVLKSDDVAKEKEPGWLDGGQAGLKLQHDGEQDINIDLLMQIWGSRTTCPWRILYPLGPGEVTPGRWDFDAFITELGDEEFAVEEDKLIGVMATLEITGLPVFTPAT